MTVETGRMSGTAREKKRVKVNRLIAMHTLKPRSWNHC